MTKSNLWNVRQAAEFLGVHENTIRNWSKQGLLNPVELPGSGYKRFDPRELNEMKEKMNDPRRRAIRMLEALAVPEERRDAITYEMTCRCVDAIIEASKPRRKGLFRVD